MTEIIRNKRTTGITKKLKFIKEQEKQHEQKNKHHAEQKEKKLRSAKKEIWLWRIEE
ncbi:hypothetical protein SESBI_43003 [Sesbania bispinosa]|nr:hypothetical protein SESBI_43003 [Sesbania bispinosa]